MTEGPEIYAVETVIDNGKFGTRTVKFETGLLARQAAGSVTAYLDDETMLLSATTAGKHPKDHFDFFPLTIDVEERMYAVGQIPGSFFRSEGRPGEDAILTCRLIDRPLRPTFKKGLRNEVQVVITVLALDPDQPYDVLAINAASMSTQLSGLPFSGPVGGVRVALIDGQWVALPVAQPARGRRLRHGRRGPGHRDRRRRDHDGRGGVHRGRPGASSRAAPRRRPRRSSPAASTPPSRSSSSSCEAQVELAKQAAKPVQEFPIFLDYEDDVYAAVEAAAKADLAAALTIAGKQEREARLDEIKDSRARRSSAPTSRAARRRSARRSARSPRALVRERVLRDKVRIDGRGLTDIRHAVRRGRRDPAGARLGAVRARRDPDPGRHHAEHADPGAEARHPLPGEDASLHAQVRLPAVLHR